MTVWGRVHRPRWDCSGGRYHGCPGDHKAPAGAGCGQEMNRPEGARGLGEAEGGAAAPGLGLWVSPLGRPLPQWALPR